MTWPSTLNVPCSCHSVNSHFIFPLSCLLPPVLRPSSSLSSPPGFYHHGGPWLWLPHFIFAETLLEHCGLQPLHAGPWRAVGSPAGWLPEPALSGEDDHQPVQVTNGSWVAFSHWGHGVHEVLKELKLPSSLTSTDAIQYLRHTSRLFVIYLLADTSTGWCHKTFRSTTLSNFFLILNYYFGKATQSTWVCIKLRKSWV